MTLNQNKPVHILYSAYVKGSHNNLAKNLWEHIPAHMTEAYDLLLEVRRRYSVIKGDIECLKNALKNQQKRLGILTENVSANIDNLENGVVEAGQQPMCLGGPSLILNKITYAWSLCQLGKDGFVPLFYVADYDGVQSELINIRLPSPSPRGLLISYPVEQEYHRSPIRIVPNPPEHWLKETIEKTFNNYRGLLKGRVQNDHKIVLQNLSHAMTILKNAYYSTNNVSDWSAKIIGSLLNIESNLGVPLISPSESGIRHFFQIGYEQLLAEPNRSKFIKASNRAVEIILGAGYTPQIGQRMDDYVPFFLECPTKGCNRARLELKYGQESTTISFARGQCLKCREVHEISFQRKHPDLSDWIDWISPRVDSRQVVVDSIIPVLAHIGGPGETSYYAEVIPGVKPLGIPFPIYLRYTRTFYNTPWNESYSEILKKKSFETLMKDTLFKALTSWVEARNERDPRKLKSSHNEIEKIILGTYDQLLSNLKILQLEIENIKKQLKDPEKRGFLISEMRKKQRTLKEIETYLSLAFGRFSKERFGQEVSWVWLDLAIASGINDLIGVYLRQYNSYTPNSSFYFVNL